MLYKERNFVWVRQVQALRGFFIGVKNVFQQLINFVRSLGFGHHVPHIGKLGVVGIVLRKGEGVVVGVGEGGSLVRVEGQGATLAGVVYEVTILVPFLYDLLESTVLYVDLVDKLRILVVNLGHLSSFRY